MNRPENRGSPAPREAPGTSGDPIDRRRFLVLMGGAAVLAAAGPRLVSAAKDTARVWPQALPTELPSSQVEVARALIGAATLAPSDWNTQPWSFEVDGASIRLVADPQRALPVADPDRRGMMIALGAALENLLVAARAYGLRPAVAYFPHGGANSVVAEVVWREGETQRDTGMSAAIPERRTNRREFDGRAILPQVRAQLTAQVPEGLSLLWIDERDPLRDVADLVHDATREQILDPRVQAEQFAWMRFDDQAEKRHDGIPVDALELGGPSGWFASHTYNPNSRFLHFGAEGAGKQARSQVRSAGALALLCGGRREESQWLMAGQAFERLCLKATQLGVAHQALSAPIEAPHARAELARLFGATGEDPLILLRLGHAKPPKALPRRAVATVASFRNT
jgi:nitroreductase